MILEIWKSIFGYEGFYEVSNLGNIKSLNYHNTKQEKILKPKRDKDGYLLIILSKNNKQRTFKIHRLVAEAFIPNTENKPQVDHKNKERDDNRVENLQWLTASENNKKGFLQGRVNSEFNKQRVSQTHKGKVISDYTKQRIKETHQIICNWYNIELNLNFTGSAADLIRTFPDQKLDHTNLSRVRLKTQKQHKNWIVKEEVKI